MLTKRLLTGISLGIITLLIVIFFPLNWFFITSIPFFLFISWELNIVLGIKNIISRLISLTLIVLIGFIACFFDGHVFLIMSLASLLWVIALFFIYKFPKFTFLYNLQLVKFFLAIFMVVPAFLSINYIIGLPHGRFITLYLFAIVWAMDIGAYFAGTYFGKHKLLEKVSPKKTYEGLIGGLVAVLFVGVIIFLIFSNSYWNLPYLIIAILLTGFFAQVGDLFESMLKRQNNIKDSGQYLPGHGGIVDRVDSLLAALPVFVFLSLLL